MMPSGDLPNNGNVWQTTEPEKTTIFTERSEPIMLIVCWYLCIPVSPIKLQTVNFYIASFTHHPRVTKARTALHAHVRTLTQLATGGF